MPNSMLAGVALGFSVAVPFGPVSLICVQNSMLGGRRNGVVTGLGAATAHGIFATLAVTSADIGVTFLTPWAQPIRLFSALILITLGIRTLLRDRVQRSAARTVSLRAGYSSAFMLTLSNPMTIIPYLAVASAAAADHLGDAPLSVWSVPGVVIACALWYATLSNLASLINNGLKFRLDRYLNAVAGTILIVFGVVVGSGGIDVLTSR
jgi:threonine/homoserine/homoserine lactone efflux protein